MRILFIHNNFPAQFGGLAAWLAARGWDVTFATQRRDARHRGIRIVPYGTHRSASPDTHHYLRGTEQAVITAQGFARAAIALRREGYTPDVVVAHTGWGPGLFVKDVWPDTAYVQYAEWYYTHPAVDRTLHHPPGDPIDERARARARNAPFWLDYSAADATVCPTRFQADRFPAKVRGGIVVLHDGVDTDLHRPGPRDAALLAGLGIPVAAPVVTYIARGMEPTRGFPEFMQAVAVLQRRRRDVHVVLVGEDRVAYGPQPDGPTWKTRMLETLPLDTRRLHFAGLLPRSRMIGLLRSSQAHVYLSAPFVLSWSFLEAMACAAPIVAADTAPVREFMADGMTGSLVEPSDPEAVAGAIAGLLAAPEEARSMGLRARGHAVQTFDAHTLSYPRYARFLEEVAGRSDRPAAVRSCAG